MDKTTYLIGLTCPTKMIYHLQGRPTNTELDPFTDELGEVGNRVHAIARSMFPDGRWASAMTLQEVLSNNGIYFEVNIAANGFEARIDMLEVAGDTVTLREVKSSGDASKDELLQDITFQAAVLKDALAELGLNYLLRLVLMVVNKQHVMTTAEVEHQDFTGSDLLIDVDVTDDVAEYASYVLPEREVLKNFLANPTSPVLKTRCAGCEYTVAGPDQISGFSECWIGREHVGENDLHILDVTRIGHVGGPQRDVVTELTSDPNIQGGSAFNIDPMDLYKGYNHRQARQIRSVRDGIELIERELVEELSQHAYPLHFIDFEAAMSAIPDIVGSRPYEITPFQWSVHTFHFDGTIEHREWLHDGRQHPAEEFLRTLRDALGSEGTIYIWTRYEQTAVKNAIEVLQRQKGDTDLLAWAVEFIKKDNPRIVDLNKLCRDYYMHPDNGGSASIKHVLPPIWRENETVRNAFPEYVSVIDGALQDPYATLNVVNNGTAAMTAYRTLLTSAEPQPELRRQMLDYCKLDTAAMVIIWMHWMGL